MIRAENTTRFSFRASFEAMMPMDKIDHATVEAVVRG
jgi:hypothetical protein